MTEAISKFRPDRTMYLRGFDRRGCAASLHNASATGFTVSGVWSDLADFVVLVLADADDIFGHLFTTRYLPDFTLTGVVVDFDLAITNGFYPGSAKFQSVPWGALSYIDSTETPGTKPLNITSTTGMVAASATFTVNGATAAYDRVQLVFLGNEVFDYVVPGALSVTMTYYGGHPGATHKLAIGANTYSYTEPGGGGASGGAIASALAAAAAGDANGVAMAASNTVVVTPAAQLGTTVSVGDAGTDGNGTGTLWVVTAADSWIAGQLVSQINAATSSSVPLSATQSGASFTVTSTIPGTDGNTIELLEMHKTGTCYLTPAGVTKLSGGTDPTSCHVRIDFSALGIPSLRQAWLTLAPPLPIDGSDADQTLKAFAAGEFSYVVTNWTVTDPNSHTALKVAGPGSVTVGSRDGWASYTGSGWSEQAGFYFRGFAHTSANAGDTVTVVYSCQHAHNLYLGTSLISGGGTFHVKLDGAAQADVSTAADTGTPIAGRRLLASAVAAGTHTVVLTLASSTACWFDYLQAAVPSDVQIPAALNMAVNAACDYDTDQTYKLAPARALWILQRMGLGGDIDFYAGVFFALKRVRTGGNFHSATVTLSGTFATGTGTGNGDAVFVDIGGTTFGAAAYPADTLTTLAQRLVDGVNALFVGVWAAPTATAGQFTITTTSPINGFTLSVTLSAGATGKVATTGDIGAGNEGVWGVDSSQAWPLNRAFKDYLTDFAGLVAAAGQTMTVAFSQELLAPPDVNTAAGAWAQRFANGNQVLTATGFGSWGAGFVEAVSGSGPVTVQQTGHGYITGNTAHLANSSGGGGVWAVTVTDANHYQLTTQISNTGSYTPGAGDAVLIDLQTTQCTFNPATVTAYLTACHKQAAGILSGAGLTPWLQFGEVLWWFYSVVQNLAVGYASYTAPISIGTVAAHNLATGDRAIVAGVQGNTAANGDQTITVVDATHFTEDGTSGNGNYVAGTGTVSGGGMAYYDAWAQSAANTALGRALANFQHQDDDPTVNGGADTGWLAGCIKTHIDAIRTAVLAAYGGAKFELLWPFDVNFPTCYYTPDVPYPQGGRLNRAVNLPAQYMTQAGSGLDRLKIEALSWGATYRNLDNAKAAIAVAAGFGPGNWPTAKRAYLVAIDNGGCPWPAEYLAVQAAGMPLVNLWAVDHLTLFSWPVQPLPAQTRFAAWN